MTSEEERLTLVTDFGSLRVGDLVVVKPCSLCGRAERAILVAKLRDGTDAVTGEGIAVAFEMYPRPACAVDDMVDVIDHVSVDLRIVYRVETGVSRETETRIANPLKNRESVDAWAKGRLGR